MGCERSGGTFRAKMEPRSLKSALGAFWRDLTLAKTKKGSATKKQPAEELLFHLEFCGTRGARERDDVPNVLHAGHEQDETLESEAETCVRA